MTPTRFVNSGEVRLAVYIWGKVPTRQRPRPVVLLVHGYPDSAEAWAPVAEHLAERCYVIAYDVRGAGRSSAPQGSAAYGFAQLSADLCAVIDAVSPKQPVHLVGYDWGALQGWEAVLSGALEGRVASFSAATPSLDHVGQWFQQRLRQPTPRHLAQFLGRVLGSSYMLAFQLPLLPELTWKLGLGRVWHRLVSRLEGVALPARAGQAADGVHGLGLYRANLLRPLLRPQARRTELPGQLLVMRQDPFVPAPMFAGMETTAPNFRRTEIAGGHWTLLSRPQPLAAALSDFVTTIEQA